MYYSQGIRCLQWKSIAVLMYILAFSQLAAGQVTEATIRQLHGALEQDDYRYLKKYLHKELSYTHSNGWTESKEELIENLRKDVLVYHRIELDSLVLTHYPDSVFATYRADVDLHLRGAPMKVALWVEQCWTKKGRRWVLFRRKSTKREL